MVDFNKPFHLKLNISQSLTTKKDLVLKPSTEETFNLDVLKTKIHNGELDEAKAYLEKFNMLFSIETKNGDTTFIIKYNGAWYHITYQNNPADDDGNSVDGEAPDVDEPSKPDAPVRDGNTVDDNTPITDNHEVKRLLDQYKNEVIEDFKTNYQSYGLLTEPSEIEVRIFSNIIINNAIITSNKTPTKQEIKDCVEEVRLRAKNVVVQMRINKGEFDKIGDDELEKAIFNQIQTFLTDVRINYKKFDLVFELSDEELATIESNLLNSCTASALRDSKETNLNTWINNQAERMLAQIKDEQLASVGGKTAAAALDIYNEGLLSDTNITRLIRDLDNYHSKSMHTEFGIDNDGNIVFENKTTENIYNEVFDIVLDEIKDDCKEALKALGGEDVLKKLFQAAWIATYNIFNSSESNDTGDFVKQVLENFKNMIKKISETPEYLEILTKHSSYSDTELTKDSPTYSQFSKNADKTEIDVRGKKDDDGKWVLDDPQDNALYQQVMDEIFESLCDKYPTIARSTLKTLFEQAKYNAINAVINKLKDCPYGTGDNGQSLTNIDNMNWKGSDANSYKPTLEEIVHLTLYQFDKVLYNAITSGNLELAKDGDEVGSKSKTAPGNRAGESGLTPEKAAEIESAAQSINEDGLLSDTNITRLIRDLDNYHSKSMHTEFGIDNDGNIVFENKTTENIYNEVFDIVLDEIKDDCKEALKALGGEDVLKKLFQAAWIATYNIFNSSESNDTGDFVKQVLENFKSMMKQISENPEYLAIFTRHTAYGNTEIGAKTEHYSWDEASKINIADNVDNQDDVYLQQALDSLFENICKAYPELSISQLRKIFDKAKENTNEAIKNKKNDCPFGTGDNAYSLTDHGKNWQDSKVTIAQYVELLCYNFDKELYNTLFTKDWEDLNGSKAS